MEEFLDYWDNRIYEICNAIQPYLVMALFIFGVIYLRRKKDKEKE